MQLDDESDGFGGIPLMALSDAAAGNKLNNLNLQKDLQKNKFQAEKSLDDLVKGIFVEVQKSVKNTEKTIE